MMKWAVLLLCSASSAFAAIDCDLIDTDLQFDMSYQHSRGVHPGSLTVQCANESGAAVLARYRVSFDTGRTTVMRHESLPRLKVPYEIFMDAGLRRPWRDRVPFVLENSVHLGPNDVKEIRHDVYIRLRDAEGSGTYKHNVTVKVELLD